MATLWHATADGFVPCLLQAAATAGAGNGDGLSAICTGFLIVAFRNGARSSHVLVADAGVSVLVNGLPVVGGLRVLEDKDELAVGSQRMFFSAESAPVVDVYRHGASTRRPRCPVCRAEIREGQSVVRCPGCSRVYHQVAATDGAPEKPCWTYSPACRFCNHPTPMSGEPSWRPAEEEPFEQHS